MTSTARQSVSLVLNGHASRSHAVVWDLSAIAGAALAARLGTGGDAPRAIELRVGPGRCTGLASVSLCAVLASGERRELRAAEDAAGVWRSDEAFEHFDAPGIARWSRRRGADGPLFARCAWLSETGVPAGSYSLRLGPG